MAKTTVVAATTTLTMIVEDVRLRDPETGDLSDLTSADSVDFKIYDADGTLVDTVTGNQEGSDNTWNADYDFDTVGEFTWQCVIENDGVTLTTRAEHVRVV
jgi:hypothetical protein